MKTVIRQLQKSRKTRGIRGTIWHVLWTLPGEKLQHLLRPHAQGSAPVDRDFDAEHGTNTRGFMNLAAFDGLPQTWMHGCPYQGVYAPRFRRTLDALPFNLAPCTFIDFGSGLGRAVLIARTYPFSAVIGVEFAKVLCDGAEENLRIARKLPQRCGSVNIVRGDATEFSLPDSPLVLFFHNPFQAPIMSRVVANVIASYRETPRPIAVLLDSVECPECWDAADFLVREPDIGVVRVLVSPELADLRFSYPAR